MLGYWRDGDATAETIKPGRWLDTGDIGHVDDGMLFINSRASDMILRSGENIYPVEIENRLAAPPVGRRRRGPRRRPRGSSVRK